MVEMKFGGDNFYLKACMSFSNEEVFFSPAPDSFVACKGPSLELASEANPITVWRKACLWLWIL